MRDDGSMGRRAFLRSAAAGMTSLVLARSVGAVQNGGSPEARSPERKLLFRTLGKSGIRLPVISMGVMNADNPNLVRAALDAGIIHFDTAHSYQKGRNEAMLGEVFKGVPRDRYVLATKVGGDGMDRRTGRFTPETKGEEFLRRFELSLQRLGSGHVDILYLHNVWTREAALFEPLLKALERVRKEGKARFVGLSTHRNEPEVIQAATESRLYDVVLTAYNFKQDHAHEVRQAIAKAGQAGLGVVAMKTLAGGYLDHEKQHPVNPKAALKWVLQDPNVHTAIPGFTTFEQMDLDLSVMEDLTLEESEKKDLRIGLSRTGLYCQGCGACTSQCLGRLPIPDLMRAHMYALGYGNLEEAQDLLSSLDLPDDPCRGCEPCPVRCRKGFSVSKKIREVGSIRKVPTPFVA